MRSLLRTGLLSLAVGCSLLGRAHAQSFPLAYDVVYRPAGTRYQVLTSRHFQVIFQDGAETEARDLAAILEAELPETQALVGTERRLRMPVVLNRFTDVANGFVTPLPFKQEIEAVNIKGNRLSARHTSWLWAVGPHELAHAVHAQSGTGLGVGAVVRWFAPDVTRSLNLTMPPGIIEGAAVYRESRVQPGAGRLNFSLFRMPFRAAMASEKPWSLAQMLEAPAYSQPFNRFYIGGAHLFQYLAEPDGGRFFRRVLALHYRMPFLGHGVELWYGTGVWPAALGRRFRASMRRQEAARLEALGTLTQPRTITGAPGRQQRRPRWLNDSTLVVYVSGYAVRPGFYRIDAATGQRTLISHQRITEDFYFSLGEEGRALYFTRYVQDPFAAAKALAEVFRLNLETGRTEALTKAGRAFAPVAARGAVWALQNDGPYNRWMQVHPGKKLTPVMPSRRVSLVHLAPSPSGEMVAVLANVAGRQGLYRAVFGADGTPTLTPWLFFAEASILDADWSPEGRFLLLTADLDGVANVYAYEQHTDRVLQLTNVAFGAMEPSLSPDGGTLAFVQYHHERFDLVQITFAPEQAEEVPRARRASGVAWAATQPIEAMDEAADVGPIRPYRARSYLAPRMIYPTLRYDGRAAGGNEEDTDLGVGVGLAVQGEDPLERWAYGAEAFYQDARVWGRLTATTGRTVLRPALSFYDVPTTVVVPVVDDAGQVVGSRRVGREERGATVGVRLPVVLASNVFGTAASVSLRGGYEQERFFGPDGKTLVPTGGNGSSPGTFRSRLRLTPAVSLVYRLQANPRDVRPNTGTTLTASATVDAWREAEDRQRGLIAQLTHYRSLSLRRHTGVRLQAGLLTQNRGALYNLDHFLPRGYEDAFLDRGTFLQLGLDLVQPLWFIDNGFVILPVYFKALYAYGFAEGITPVDSRARTWSRYTAVGGGFGLQLRFFYLVDLDLRLGASYLPEEQRWEVTYR